MALQDHSPEPSSAQGSLRVLPWGEDTKRLNLKLKAWLSLQSLLEPSKPVDSKASSKSLPPDVTRGKVLRAWLGELTQASPRVGPLSCICPPTQGTTFPFASLSSRNQGHTTSQTFASGRENLCEPQAHKNKDKQTPNNLHRWNLLTGKTAHLLHLHSFWNSSTQKGDSHTYTHTHTHHTSHTHTTPHTHTTHITHHIHTPHHTSHTYSTPHIPHTHTTHHTHTYRQGPPREEWSCKSPSAASQPKGQAKRGV